MPFKNKEPVVQPAAKEHGKKKGHKISKDAFKAMTTIYEQFLNRLPRLLLIAGIFMAFSWAMTIPNIPISDQDIYHRTALSLASGQGLLDDSGRPTAYWAPGYSFYLAAFYYLFGSGMHVAFAANIVSYLVLIAATYGLAKLLYSPNSAWLAAVITAWYPAFIFYTTILASELLFCALLVAALYFSWKSLKKLPLVIPSGILFGAASLVRPPGEILPITIFLMGWIQGISRKRTTAAFLLIILIAFLTLLPWGLRNQRELGQFVLVSANFGANLWDGNHSGATGSYVGIDGIIKEAHLENIPLAERDAALRDIALKFIRENPFEFVKLIFKRIFVTMRSESIAVVWNKHGIETALGPSAYLVLKIIENLSYYALIIGAGCVLWRLWHSRGFSKSDFFIAAVLLLLSIPFALFQAQDRYHLPLIPFFIIFASRIEDIKI